MEVTCVLPAGAVLGEGALWDFTEQALYWVDIKGRRVHRFDPRRGQDQHWSVAEDVGSLGVRAGGGLVLAMRSGFHFFDPDTGRTTAVVAPEPERQENRFNDGKTDRQGRFWAGSMHDPETRLTGGLYRLDTDLSCHRLIDGLVVSNALCWSPDSRTMYHTDTPSRIVWAWEFDPASGHIANRRAFVRIPDTDGYPDGATVDADGFVWLAHWDGWRVTRYDAAGRVERVVRLPVQRPTCPAFGGASLDILYVTSASIGLSAEERARQPWAGGVLALDPGVRGIAERRFEG
jgi:sugar lactone lactonase YvrE